MKKKNSTQKVRRKRRATTAQTVSKREYDYLVQELSYYREKYDEEKRRADALVNTLLQGNGLPAPQIEDASLATHPKDTRRLLVERRLVELFEDEIADTLEIAPEVAEAS